MNPAGSWVYCPVKYMYFMKKFILPSAFFLLALTQVQAQTKRIAHRSHSGADRHFNLGVSDNFGNPPEDWKKVKPLPSVDTAKAATQGMVTDSTKAVAPKQKKQPARKEKPARHK